jgi:hypothetical protein
MYAGHPYDPFASDVAGLETLFGGEVGVPSAEKKASEHRAPPTVVVHPVRVSSRADVIQLDPNAAVQAANVARASLLDMGNPPLLTIRITVQS